MEQNTFSNPISVRQDRQVLRLLSGRDRPERAHQPVQGDAQEEGARGQTQTLRGPARADGQAGSLCSLKSAKRFVFLNYSGSQVNNGLNPWGFVRSNPPRG